MLKVVRIIILVGMLITGLLATGVQAASPTVVVVDVEGVINPVLADFVSRGIEEAEELNATVCILQLDTPGGLDIYNLTPRADWIRPCVILYRILLIHVCR